MKNSIKFVSFLAFALAFYSCNKDDSPSWSDGIPRIATIKSYNYDALIRIDSFKYDKQGRTSYFSTTQVYNGNYTEHSSKLYTYTSTKITIDNYLNNSKWGTQTLELNNAGLCSSAEIKDRNNCILETETLGYNNEGYLTNLELTNPTSTLQTSFIITNGNTVQSTSVLIENTTTKHYEELLNRDNFPPTYLERVPVSSAKELTLVTDYEFYTDITNTIGNQNRGITFLGKQDKFPVKSLAYSGTIQTNYTYTLDTKKRIAKQAIESDRYNIFTYY